MTSVPTAQPVGDPPGSVATALAYSRANPINRLLSESIDARIAQWGDPRRVPPPVSQRLRSQTSGVQPAPTSQAFARCVSLSTSSCGQFFPLLVQQWINTNFETIASAVSISSVLKYLFEHSALCVENGCVLVVLGVQGEQQAPQSQPQSITGQGGATLQVSGTCTPYTTFTSLLHWSWRHLHHTLYTATVPPRCTYAIDHTNLTWLFEGYAAF